MTDAEITRAVAEDPDTFIPTPAMWRKATLVLPAREAAAVVRVDPDVLAFFRRRGGDYRARINAVLRAYMRARAKDAARKRAGGRRRAA